MTITRKANVEKVIEAFMNMKARARKDVLKAQEIAEEKKAKAKEKAKSAP